MTTTDEPEPAHDTAAMTDRPEPAHDTAATAGAPARSGRSESVAVVTTLRTAMDRLLFTPRSAWPVAIARIIIGIALVGWVVSIWFDVADLLGDRAVLSSEFASTSWRWIDLDSTASIRIALVALLLAAIAVVIGFRPTVFLLLAFVLLVAIQRRNPVILNSGDLILRNLTLLLALSPTGAALSVDRWRHHGRAALRTAPLAAPWGLRLVQMQLMLVYFFAFWGKSGELWRNGTAVSTAFRLDDLQRFGQLDALVDNLALVALLTWGTLVAELMLATLLWLRPLRSYLIVVGVTLHLLIDTFILVGFFGVAMIAGLMTFLDGDRIQARLPARVT